MTEDELIREIQLKHQLSELDGTPVPKYDPSDGMETVEELKKYVRFLYELNQEKDKCILRLEGDMSEIKNDLKEANRRADDEAASRQRLFDKLEKLYASKPDYYTPDRIKDARNDEYTNGIVNSMHEKLLEYIAKGEDYFPDKVWRALNYFYNFWDQIFAYRHDGEYSIDNMAVERAIRPLTVQRKNSLFLCSEKGAKNSGIYNTFISTCVQQCRNFRDFFVDYVKAWNQGRRDFGNLVRLAFAPCT